MYVELGLGYEILGRGAVAICFFVSGVVFGVRLYGVPKMAATP